MANHPNVGVDALETFLGRDHLWPPHRIGGVEDLPLQVGQLHPVRVDDPQGSHPCGGQV